MANNYQKTSNVTHSYLLEEDPLVFDNDFFNIHLREAEAMDPQQRILLETVYEGIETAGYSMSDLKGSSTAVFLGQMSDDYRDLLLRDVDSHPQYLGTGTSRAIMANRVSYFFDWRGPSVTIDTACSSSLVALHQAIQTLRSGESDMAVAAGVNLILGPEMYIFESSVSFLSFSVLFISYWRANDLTSFCSFICFLLRVAPACGTLAPTAMAEAKGSPPWL
jgi:acyl transferase domain-containing protein